MASFGIKGKQDYSLAIRGVIAIAVLLPAMIGSVTASLQVTGPLVPDANLPTLGFGGPSGATYQQLYRADGTAIGDWGAYNHHPQIAFHASRLYVMWSNHLKDEDAAGQRVYFRHSSDFGVTWEPPINQKPIEIFPSMDDWKFAKDPAKESDRTCTADGFVDIDGALYALNEVLPSIQLQTKGVGRMARRINDDNTLGEPFWLKQHSPSSPHGYPVYADLSNPALTRTGAAIIAKLSDSSRAEIPTWDFDGEGNTSTELRFPPALPADGHRLCEPTHSFELANGIRLMFWRDLGAAGVMSHKLYVSEKSVEGPWSAPRQTDFPDAGSKSCAGQLPDGRYFIINNPSPHAGRSALVLSLSKDGLAFDQCFCIRGMKTEPRFNGRYKGPGFAYPSACVVRDQLCVIYSVNKEDIEMCSIPLASLGR